jgi:hypothetical protein
MRRRRRPAARYSELEIRRRVLNSASRLAEELRVATDPRRALISELLREHAERLPDGRIAIEAEVLKHVLDQATDGHEADVLDALLRVVFESEEGQSSDGAEPAADELRPTGSG